MTAAAFLGEESKQIQSLEGEILKGLDVNRGTYRLYKRMATSFKVVKRFESHIDRIKMSQTTSKNFVFYLSLTNHTQIRNSIQSL